jgi:hypothetical protein
LPLSALAKRLKEPRSDGHASQLPILVGVEGDDLFCKVDITPPEIAKIAAPHPGLVQDVHHIPNINSLWFLAGFF